MKSKIANARGCKSTACSTRQRGPDDLPDAVREKVSTHPCYSEQAHHFFARMHVAVAPGCNIQCHYCNRKYDCANESRPGVVSELLTPEQAVKKVLAVGSAIPQLSVVGIAGPGDPLANPARTFATFRGIAQQAPDLKLCLSTNGLRLPEYVEEIVSHRIDHVTITINSIDPAVAEGIYSWVHWDRQRLRGLAAARVLLEQQQQGLEMLIERGVLVKVNSVMIPGVNDEHLQEVSRFVKAKGAFVHNVMPLITAPGLGTHYSLNGQRAPTAGELQALQDACGGEMSMMRHCRQCRADAVGLLGEDRGAEFGLERIDGLADDPAAAMAQRARVREDLKARLAKRWKIVPVQEKRLGFPLLIAVASRGDGLVNQHFGHAREFLIYEASSSGVRFIGTRRADQYCTGPDNCGDNELTLEHAVQSLKGCRAVLCARIGFAPKEALSAAGILVDCNYAMEPIETAVAALYRGLAESEGNSEQEA